MELARSGQGSDRRQLGINGRIPHPPLIIVRHRPEPAKERSASLRDGLRPLPAEPGRESLVLAAAGMGASIDLLQEPT